SEPGPAEPRPRVSPRGSPPPTLRGRRRAVPVPRPPVVGPGPRPRAGRTADRPPAGAPAPRRQPGGPQRRPQPALGTPRAGVLVRGRPARRDSAARRDHPPPGGRAASAPTPGRRPGEPG